MKGFTKCEKGHFYKQDLPECPYCPKPGAQHSRGSADKTQIVGGGIDTTQAPSGSDLQKTQIYGGTAPAGVKTEIHTPKAPKRDLSRTYIQGMDEGDNDTAPTARATRKITGWLISYTLDPMGTDYRIYEGNNRIGKQPGSEITIVSDHSVSSLHAVILYRDSKWYISDEMSSNGTFLNGEGLPPRQAVDLHDNDQIKVGDTVFKFKTAL